MTPASDAVVLQGDSPDAYNDVTASDRVVPATVTIHRDGEISLPPHSLAVVSISTPKP